MFINFRCFLNNRCFRPLLLSLSLILLSTPATYAQTSELTLTENQKSLLKDRSLLRDGFSVRILNGRIHDEPRTIVLLGETHFKTDATTTKARNIINNFDFYGLEGLDTKQYWGEGQAMSHLLDGISSLLKRFFDGSSVNDAFDREDSGYDEVKICALLQQKYAEGNIRSLEDLSRINQELGPRAVPDPLLEKIYDLISNQKHCEDSFTKALYLEEGYKPKLQDNLAVFLYPVVISTVLVQKCSAVACTKWPQFRLLSALKKIPIPAIKAFSAYLIADIGARLLFDDKKWLDNIFIFSTGLFYNRNQFMSENIIKGFEENPQRKNMLVIMGLAHLHSIKHLLIERYGFEEVTLP